MEAVHIARCCAIVDAWPVTVEQVVLVWHVRVIALFQGHNAFAILVLFLIFNLIFL